MRKLSPHNHFSNDLNAGNSETRKRKNSEADAEPSVQRATRTSQEKNGSEPAQKKNTECQSVDPTPRAVAKTRNNKLSDGLEATNAAAISSPVPLAKAPKATALAKAVKGTKPIPVSEIPSMSNTSFQMFATGNGNEGSSDSSVDSDSVASGENSGDDEKVKFAGNAAKASLKRSSAGPKERNKTSRKNRTFSVEDDANIVQAVQAAIARKSHVNWSALGESMGRMGCICRRRWFRHLSKQYGEEMKLPNHFKPSLLSSHAFGSVGVLGDHLHRDDVSEEADANRKPRHTFTLQDDEHILQAVREAQTEGTMMLWEEVAGPLQRTGQACKQRWKLSLAPRHPELHILSQSDIALNFNYTPMRKPRQAFTEPDDTYIVHAVRTAHTNGMSVQWEEVGEALQRTGQACKQRWLISLAARHPEVSLLVSEEFSQNNGSVPGLNYNPTRKVRQVFTDLDDSHIMHAVRTAQNEGKEIVWRDVGLPLDRTGEACKQRWRLTLAVRYPELTTKV